MKIFKILFLLLYLFLFVSGCNTTLGSGDTTPDKPVVTAKGAYHAVRLTWDSISTATSYNIYYSDSPNVGMASYNKIENATSPYFQKDLTNGTEYYYIVTAVNQIGEGLPSAEVSATPEFSGILDTSYGTDGFFDTQIIASMSDFDFGTDADGNIYIASAYEDENDNKMFYVMKILKEGGFDASYGFNRAGVANVLLSDCISDCDLDNMLVDSYGNTYFVFSGNITGPTAKSFIEKIDPYGYPDPDFGSSGVETYDEGFKRAVLLNDNTILISGYYNNSGQYGSVLKVDTDRGRIDTTFGTSSGRFLYQRSGVDTTFKEIALSSINDNILVSGESSNASFVASINSTGTSLDSTFSGDGILAIDSGDPGSIVIDEGYLYITIDEDEKPGSIRKVTADTGEENILFGLSDGWMYPQIGQVLNVLPFDDHLLVGYHADDMYIFSSQIFALNSLTGIADTNIFENGSFSSDAYAPIPVLVTEDGVLCVDLFASTTTSGFRLELSLLR